MVVLAGTMEGQSHVMELPCPTEENKHWLINHRMDLTTFNEVGNTTQWEDDL